MENHWFRLGDHGRYPTHKPINLTPEIRAAMNALASKGMLLATELFDLVALFGARNKGRETQMSDAYDLSPLNSRKPKGIFTQINMLLAAIMFALLGFLCLGCVLYFLQQSHTELSRLDLFGAELKKAAMLESPFVRWANSLCAIAILLMLAGGIAAIASAIRAANSKEIVFALLILILNVLVGFAPYALFLYAIMNRA